MKVALVIPTLNAGDKFQTVLEMIHTQKEECDIVKIVDSSSDDNTVMIAKKFNCEIESIQKREFSHGGTRRLLAEEMKNRGFDYIIFMTQDVFLKQNAIGNLKKFINGDTTIGVVFGKQEVDLSEGNYFEYYARKYNYPDKSYIREKKDIPTKGIKTIFSSDAFAIYNLSILQEVDYFEDSKLVSEDMLVAHKIISAGYKIGYCSEACVYHTHNYSIREEYRRYIEIGKFYKKHNDIVSKYGKTSSNGIKLVLGEILFLTKIKKMHYIPLSIARNFSKFLGHRKGMKIFE